MEMEEWMKHLKECKGYKDIKINDLRAIRRDGEVNLTYRDKVVEVKTEKHLTYFEAKLLVAMFGYKKLVRDYAKYHKCEAGKEFIKQIKSVREVKITDIIKELKPNWRD